MLVIMVGMMMLEWYRGNALYWMVWYGIVYIEWYDMVEWFILNGMIWNGLYWMVGYGMVYIEWYDMEWFILNGMICWNGMSFYLYGMFDIDDVWMLEWEWGHYLYGMFDIDNVWMLEWDEVIICLECLTSMVYECWNEMRSLFVWNVWHRRRIQNINSRIHFKKMFYVYAYELNDWFVVFPVFTSITIASFIDLCRHHTHEL